VIPQYACVQLLTNCNITWPSRPWCDVVDMWCGCLLQDVSISVLAPTPVEVHEAQFVLPQLAPQQRGSALTTLQLVFQGASSSGDKPICLPASSKAQVTTDIHAIVCWHNNCSSCLGSDSGTFLRLEQLAYQRS